ncbi:MAG: Na(+)/H(+) antiporter subunit D [Thermodesulfobacteriota bacterium]|nr:Na(+)/H(+) antiporter subunit D [Thermodesulfobacteriota bacterium]
MIENVPIGAIFIIGALFVPFLRGKTKSSHILFLPVLAFIVLLNMPDGKHCVISFLDYNLILARVDKLSRLFGYIFIIWAFLALLYSIHLKDKVQQTVALIYSGSALGIVFSGDLFSLYIFWEVLAMSSTMLIWARRGSESIRAGFRYLLVHAVGGLSLLAGIVIYIAKTGSPEFGYIGFSGAASYLLLFGFCLNTAVIPLHFWVPDAYPETTVEGAIFLSVFTTKTGVYILARTFPGAELLAWLGAIMTAFPIFYAVISNDIRRVLAYSLLNQVGFMVCGIGLGTALAINGAVSHAFCNILFEGLLFMATGAVLYMTGKSNCTDLGGLYKSMPITCGLCLVGAMSIGGFPLFSGFISESMTITASAKESLPIMWFILQFSAVGVLHHASIKIPFFTFFSEDSGIRTKEPPFNMLLAMSIAAVLSIVIGIFPDVLYRILPYPVDYKPYTFDHVLGKLQLLLFGGLAFCLLIFSGYYPPEKRTINLDVDWFLYRKPVQYGLPALQYIFGGIASVMSRIFTESAPKVLANFISKPRLKTDRLLSPMGVSALIATAFISILFALFSFL